MTAMTESSSGFITPAEFSTEWRDITLVQQRKHTLIYTASRYGRRFMLKTLAPEYAQLTDYRLQQEREFQLGVQLVHPNIAATYGLEQVEGVGRCIVQEWIDGVTLGEWVGSKPTSAARERVLGQLLDALEYLHNRQLVHHDLKSDNILITSNGTNVKLIDFGLSATDSMLSPVDNDPRADIVSLGRLLPELLPGRRCPARRCHDGRFANIAALRQALTRRKRVRQLLPVILSVVLLAIASALFYFSLTKRNDEQQRYERMIAVVDEHIAHERELLTELANRSCSFESKNAADMNAYAEYLNEYAALRQHQWTVRDSLINTYPVNDPLREQLFQYWCRKELDLDNEIYPQLTGKLK
ncbi:MAG: protein kinase [Paludibacteraceae bacterium]|nr:protein kinase [Paludibacteraceae bacterium]